jgi:phosphoribosylglycinamide formyltransferase-1
LSGELSPLPVVVLISGEGTNLQALLDAERRREIGTTIRAAISDRRSAPGLDRARRAGVDAVYVEPHAQGGRAVYDAALLDALDRYRPSLVVLAGFMRILGKRAVSELKGRLLNIHPSLLPRHRGLDTHRRVLEAGDRFHGATVHFVTDDLDAGPRVIQYRFAVQPADDAKSLAARVHAGEYQILPRAVGWFAAGRLRLGADGVMLDGKPLPEPVLVEG